MPKTVLITGGGGFIGTHLTRALTGKVEKIVLVDNLLPQVHLGKTDFPDELKSLATCIVGDIRDIAVLKEIARAHPDIETVIHLAAMTGTGQSMYAVRDYDSVNSGGTAALLEALLDTRDPETAFAHLKKVVLSSSRAIYGEGAYRCPNDPTGTLHYPPQRTAEQLAKHEWGFYHEGCTAELEPVPTPEDAPPQPTSFYGVTKLVQEQYLNTMLKAAGIESTILRFQNVFGPGQSLKNPYTGVIGVFYSNIVGGRPLDLYEDATVTRDFVFISDVVDSIVAATLTDVTGTYNVGTGLFTKLSDVALWLMEAIGKTVPVGCSGMYRVGDIRHNASDLTRSEASLGYSPKVSVQEGLRRYVEWASAETPMDAATIAAATDELKRAGLSGN